MAWRDVARPIIAEVLAKGGTRQEQNRLLRDAYPFGQRKYHPYKIWLDEIKLQRGEKKKRFQNLKGTSLETEGQLTLAEVYGEIEIK